MDANAVAAHLAHGDYLGKCIIASSSSSVVVVEDAAMPLKLYPNPAKGIIKVSFSSTNETKAQIKVIDVTGRTVFNTQVQAVKGYNTHQLNLTHIAGGMYWLELNNGNLQQRVKFVIEK